ncbi:MAG: hypothetical protein PUF08_07630 [Clostridiales bacterium]|nr:hypothetical protein [Clostridiales bacterium]
MIIYILCLIIVLQSIIHHIERKDLYNRIMSKNLTEYKGEKCHSMQSAHDRSIKRWRGLDGENK